MNEVFVIFAEIFRMILYSVTINIDESVHDEWLAWMKKIHIPEVMATGLFISHRMYRLLSAQAEETGTTYSIQYFLENLENYKEYQQKRAPALQQEYLDKYQDKFAAFR